MINDLIYFVIDIVYDVLWNNLIYYTTSVNLYCSATGKSIEKDYANCSYVIIAAEETGDELCLAR